MLRPISSWHAQRIGQKIHSDQAVPFFQIPNRPTHPRRFDSVFVFSPYGDYDNRRYPARIPDSRCDLGKGLLRMAQSKPSAKDGTPKRIKNKATTPENTHSTGHSRQKLLDQQLARLVS